MTDAEKVAAAVAVLCAAAREAFEGLTDEQKREAVRIFGELTNTAPPRRAPYGRPDGQASR